MRTASEVLRFIEIRVARLERIAEEEEGFLEAVAGKKFINSETGNKVLFDSLPTSDQQSLREKYKKHREKKNSKKDSGFSDKARKSLSVVLDHVLDDTDPEDSKSIEYSVEGIIEDVSIRIMEDGDVGGKSFSELASELGVKLPKKLKTEEFGEVNIEKDYKDYNFDSPEEFVNYLGKSNEKEMVSNFYDTIKSKSTELLKSKAKKASVMRTASEVLRSLEARIARLEGRTAGATNKTANEIATTILQQLGGSRKLQMMIGLKQVISEPLGVTLVFPLPSHEGAVNRVRITLNGLDLYDMEFIRTRGTSLKVVKEFDNVYAEDLKSMFEKGTGLYIRF